MEISSFQERTISRWNRKEKRCCVCFHNGKIKPRFHRSLYFLYNFLETFSDVLRGSEASCESRVSISRLFQNILSSQISLNEQKHIEKARCAFRFGSLCAKKQSCFSEFETGEIAGTYYRIAFAVRFSLFGLSCLILNGRSNYV